MSEKFKQGHKFGKLTLLETFRAKRPNGKVRKMARCLCECGNEHIAELCNLPTGNTRWCKACANKYKSSHAKTHGHSYICKSASKIEKKCYYTWQAIKHRCLNKNDERYGDYGGRGITLCEEWHNYESFLRDMGLPPTKAHQIDRKDNEKGYYADNCRWVTNIENARNKRNSRFIEYAGERKTLAEWVELTGIQRKTITTRIDRGWTVGQALGKETVIKWQRKKS